MALFNPQTQYTADVSQANAQVADQANDISNYMSSLIEADAIHRQSNAKMINEIGPLLSQYGKIAKDIQNVEKFRQKLSSTKQTVTSVIQNTESNMVKIDLTTQINMKMHYELKN